MLSEANGFPVRQEVSFSEADQEHLFDIVFFQERMLLLSDKAVYRIKYDFDSKQVSSTKAVSLVR